MTDTLVKEAGDVKELHAARLVAAQPLLDIDAYVEDFNRDVVTAYRRGIADAEMPADVGLARSILPPGTAATRDFSGLAPRIPEYVAEKCVGCMACISACPDSALFAVVTPASQVEPAVEAFAATQPDPARAAETARSHFVDVDKYGKVMERKGEEPGRFGIFVDPVH